MTLSIHSPYELIAALPHLLGFTPEESIVFIPLGPDLPLARIDLPTTAAARDEVWNTIHAAFSRYAHSGASVAIVCMSDDLEAAELVGHHFAVRLSSIGIRCPAETVGGRHSLVRPR